MKLPRIFSPRALQSGTRQILDETAIRHLRVLRLRVGASLVLFDGLGGEYSGELLGLERHHAEVLVGKFHPVESESPLSLTLIQAVSKGERMDWLIQKAVELGVAEIRPVFSGRSVVQLDARRAEKRHAHWQGVIRNACEQCGRNRLPVLHAPCALEAVWSSLGPGLQLVLDPLGGQRLREISRPDPASPVQLLVGPEGGFDQEELTVAGRQGFVSIQLGPRVLRTETAGITTIAALQTLWGDLG